MKGAKKIGLVLLIIGLTMFTGLSFLGDYEITEPQLESWASTKGIKSEVFLDDLKNHVVGKSYSNPFGISAEIIGYAQASHEFHVNQIRNWESEGRDQEKINREWSKVIWLSWYKSHKEVTYELLKTAVNSPVTKHRFLYFFLTFGFAIIGSLMFILPNMVLLGPPGIKNNLKSNKK